MVRQEERKSIEGLARFGMIAKGVVYFLVGVLTASAAFGFGGRTAGQKEALFSILGEPFGQVILGIIAAGLFAYAIWRFILAVSDADNHGSDTKGILARLGEAGSGVSYGALGVYSASLVIGRSGGGSLGSGGKQGFVATLLRQPFGQWLVGIVAVAIAVFAVYELLRAYKASFMKHEKTAEMSEKQIRTARIAGRAGYTARGIVFLIIAYFFLRAAIEANPNRAQGTESAFSFLSSSPAGPWLMGIVALGVAAYGIYMFMTARFRRIQLSA